ncbi:hypothetical protein [Thermoanaerobacterium sp. DL9XJH110]|uniref:hypothetical protein n=1 Tax=Thermoanaerobacterium sp. DL9XJH110 TaxID=3386643 RepID=UPI003BB66978
MSLKEIKKLSDKVLLYKEWEESSSGHMEITYWVKIIPGSNSDFIFEEGKKIEYFIHPKTKKSISRYEISLKAFMDFVRQHGQRIT